MTNYLEMFRQAPGMLAASPQRAKGAAVPKHRRESK